MATKIEKKRIEELENYNITKATENDVIPVVETKDGANEAKKLPVTTLRDMMAKFNITNVVTLVVSLLNALRNAAGEELAAQIERFYAGYAGFMTAIQENEIDFNALAASVVEHSSDEMIEVIYGLIVGGDGGKGEEPTTEEKRQGLIEGLTGGDFDIVKGIGSFLGRNNMRISDLEDESEGIDGRLRYIENTQIPDISSRLQAIEEAIQQFQNSNNE